MTLQDAAYSHSPARIRQQSSAPTLPTSPRASMNPNNPNSSPAPRVPMGRSPHQLALRNSQAQFTQSAGEEGDEERRSSVDSAAIFSIYSMYGSEYGSASVPALPAGADRASGSWRDSQGPSPLSSSSYNINHAHQDAPHTNAAWASHLGNNGHTAQDHLQHQSQDQTPRNSLFQQHRQRSQEVRTSQVPAAPSYQVPFEAAGHSDSERRSTGFTTTAAQSSTPPSSYQLASGVNGKHVAHRSSSFSSYSDDLRRVQSDNEDDESLALDVDFGSTVGSQSSPPSPSSKKESMSFFSSSKRSRKSNRTTASSAAGLAYFDSGVMPSVPAPPRTPSPSSAGTSRAPSAMSGARSGLDHSGLEPDRGSYAGSGNGRANDDFSGKANGRNGNNNNRMSMSSWLPDATSYNRGSQSATPNPQEGTTVINDWDDGHVYNPQPGVHPQAVTASSQSQAHSQPPVSFVPGVSPGRPFPPQHSHLHTPSNGSAYTNSYFSSRSTSPSVSVYATPLTSPTVVKVLGTAKPEYHATSTEDAENTDSMPVNNNFRLGYQTPSRRGSPSPSLTPGPSAAPPSAYQSNNQQQHSSPRSNPGSRRQTPSPAPSRTGSLAAPAHSPAPPSIHHSPHSSLSQQSTHSHHSNGASSVITKDTFISAISATTATSSGSRADESVPPPMPMYHSYGQQTPPSMLGRQTSQASQESQYSSSIGHRSIGEMQIPRVDKDLPDMPSENGAASRASNPGSRRPSPVPSLNVNGSPHLLNGDTGGIGTHQGRLVPNGISHRANDSLSPSGSQQSTIMTAATSGTGASVSSTGATTANSSPDPNYRNGGPSGANGAGPSPVNSPHASLQAPQRSSSFMRTRGNSPSTLQQNSGNSPHQSLLSGPAGSIKGHSTPSLVPSLGEDLDAFHVRNTYAVLEVSGVKGDGYEEGVERTRAARSRAASNMTPSPSQGGADTSGNAEDGASSSGQAKARKTKSQVLADEAIADENEKKRELDPKEIQILSSLDRYGFFNVPSHDRLLLMPSAPLTKPLPFSPAAAASPTPSSPPPPGSGNASATPRTLSALPPVVTPPKETERIAKWGRMLVPHERDEGGNVQAWRIRPNKVNKLRRRTYKGIPDRWRAAAWEVLMTAYSSASEEGGHGSKGEDGAGDVSVERTLRNASSEAAASAGVRQVKVTEREYRECLDKPSSYDIQIDLDVPRTISGHIMFRTRYGAGQRSLFHVLHSFSLRCVTCGYVQGMGPIAATLLSYMAPSLAYTSLVRLHDAYAMHSIFAPGFPGLLEAIYVQERLTQTTMPGVYAAFQKHMISTTSYATKWYITLFANSVPFQTQLRFWDVFLLEGPDVYIAVAIAIVWVYRDHITSAAANFETVLSLLSGFFVPEDENQLLGWMEKMLGDKKIRGAMRAWRLEWRELVKQGKDGSALL